MQSLCTLRNHCRQWPRNTRYQADATPYLGRTCTGWIAPALPGALRGRDASYLAPPAQIRTCGFPAYGSHLGYRRQIGAVDEPAACVTLIRRRVRRLLSWRAFPSVPALRSTNSAADRSALFVGFTATMARSDFSCPCIIGYGSSPSRCGPSRSRDADGRTRDLPGSDAIPLHVMWP